jgi:pSer/pThr/pTyr-binding forkhead associated (FHA) protein
MIGGALGGAIGGGTFDFVSIATEPISRAIKQGDESGIAGRAVTCLIIGAAIGLFLSIIRQASKVAWVRLNLGRNEGKEWLVESGQTFIGRDERADIPLMGDMNVIGKHACIVRQGAGYLLADGGSPIGTYLNGQRITQAPLVHGSQIQIGPYMLEFQLREGAARRAAEQLRGVPVTAPMATPMTTPMATPMRPNPSSATTIMATPSAVSMSVVVLGGPYSGQRFPLNGPIDVGREVQGISLAADTQSSRRHARLTPTQFGVEVVDLGSTNGTFVNDQRIQTATARPGDVIKIGGTSMRVEA